MALKSIKGWSPAWLGYRGQTALGSYTSVTLVGLMHGSLKGQLPCLLVHLFCTQSHCVTVTEPDVSKLRGKVGRQEAQN